MRLKLQITVTLICLAVLFKLLNMVRKNKVELKYSFSLILADIGVLLLCYMPSLLRKIASALDIYEPLHLVIFIGFLFMGSLIFSQSRLIADNLKKNVRLTQELALLQKELEEMKQEESNGFNSEK